MSEIAKPSAPRHPKEYLHCGIHRQVEVPVRIHWTYAGESGVADYTDIASPNEEGTGWALSEYGWSDGNYGCDCNRTDFIGLKPERFPELFHLPGQMYGDGSGPVEGEPQARCGHKIFIARIESLDPLVPSLELEETPCEDCAGTGKVDGETCHICGGWG